MGKYTTIVDELPFCDFCVAEGQDVLAKFDGKTKTGPWANMCLRHFDQHGLGVGVGKGQELVVTIE